MYCKIFVLALYIHICAHFIIYICTHVCICVEVVLDVKCISFVVNKKIEKDYITVWDLVFVPDS